jgi:hypothetical protein
MSNNYSHNLRSTARIVLFSFLLTFVAARTLVYCIMARDIPDLFLYVGGTHVHHLNYGIFLLSASGAYLLFTRPSGRQFHLAAITYAVGLGLTFDEFGMWLHLGGSYWQRASFDAVTVITAVLALLVYAPRLKSFKAQDIIGALITFACICIFFFLWSRALYYGEHTIEPHLQQLEQQGPK